MAIAIHRHAHARSCSRHLANDMASDSFSALSSVGQSSISPASPDSTTNSCSIACAVNAVALRASARELAFGGLAFVGRRACGSASKKPSVAFACGADGDRAPSRLLAGLPPRARARARTAVCSALVRHAPASCRHGGRGRVSTMPARLPTSRPACAAACTAGQARRLSARANSTQSCGAAGRTCSTLSTQRHTKVRTTLWPPTSSPASFGSLRRASLATMAFQPPISVYSMAQDSTALSPCVERQWGTGNGRGEGGVA